MTRALWMLFQVALFVIFAFYGMKELHWYESLPLGFFIAYINTLALTRLYDEARALWLWLVGAKPAFVPPSGQERSSVDGRDLPSNPIEPTRKAIL